MTQVHISIANFYEIEPEKKKLSPDILKTDGGKTKSNAIEIPSITLPKGGVLSKA